MCQVFPVIIGSPSSALSVLTLSVQAYTATEHLVVLGTRAWFLDIRGCFLDCSGLENASQAPPTPLPEVGTQTAVDDPPEAPASPPQPAVNTSLGANSRRPSLKALAQVSSAFSAAKGIGSSLSAKGRSLGKATSATGFGASSAAEKKKDLDQGGGGAGSGSGTMISGVTMSMPGLFKRATRTATEEPVPSGPGKCATPQPSLLSPGGNSRSCGKDGHAWVDNDRASQPCELKVEETGGCGTHISKLPENETRERSDLFIGSSRSPSTSPRGKSHPAVASHGSKDKGISSPVVEGSTVGTGISCTAETNIRSVATGSAAAKASSLPSNAAGSGGRKEKRAFAGGLWNGGGSSGVGTRGNSAQTVGTDSVAMADKTVSVAVSHSTECGAAESEGRSLSAPSLSVGTTTKTKPAGGKRRFAGGGLSGSQAASTQPSAISLGAVESDNPFTVDSGRSGRGGAGEPSITGGRGGTMDGSSFAADQTAMTRGEARKIVQSQDPGQSVPTWAEERVPEWATESGGGGANHSDHGDRYQPSNGPVLAPPSRPGQDQEVASNSSPFMKLEPEAPPVRRPSQRRTGESGSRRAFAGGERLF